MTLRSMTLLFTRTLGRCMPSSRPIWSTMAGLCVGGTLMASLVPVSVARASFGIKTFESDFVASEDGEPGGSTYQAGSHPSLWTITIVLNNHAPSPSQEEEGFKEIPDGDVQNVDVSAPVGVIANPDATTVRCPEAELERTGDCPSASVVGQDSFVFGLDNFSETVNVYNMETTPGEPAEFGFRALDEAVTVHILGKVHSESDYGVAAEVPDVNQQVGFFSNTITLFGNPPEARQPFLTLPTSCGAPLVTTLTANSWQDPTTYLSEVSAVSQIEGNTVPVTGCNKLSFTPQITVQPTTHAANSPTGLNVEVTVPREESATSLAEAAVKETVVTLPAGMTVSSSAADGGLGACTPQQIGLGTADSPSCQPSSKVGSVEVFTPLLEQPLEGSVYLAQQGKNPFPQEDSNPFGSLIALYLVAEGKGVVIKLPGEVTLDPVTGQLTARFGEDPVRTALTGKPQYLPQLPFSHLKLNFFGGPRAALVTPPTCGTYTVTSELTPYSAPESGPPATPSSSFEINERCGGLQFSPTLAAGTENNQAGGFSPLIVTLSRAEASAPEQNPERVQVHTPPGLLGMVSSVTQCEEPQAANGTCGPASRIGSVTVGVGAGADPLYVTGEIFLTGPYDGAPFGLSIVVPAVAGPFDLGLVKVRATINVDPHTAALTITSDPLPQILDGIPLQLRTVTVDTNREHFVLNPTSCAPMSIDATVASSLGVSVPLTSRFQAANCSLLGFAPKFTVTVSGKTSHLGGTSLDAKIAYPTGTQANIAQVKVELPKQLPARLKTLQKACTSAVFEGNPASCPAASVVGIARATTPILSGALSGPVYFVSHGGEAFPDLEVILEGDGVRADLVGSTFISKANITSSTFKSVPDVPVSSFELFLPAGSDSALAANGNLCKAGLRMPTTFIAQNGAEIHQSTPIAVSGCPKAKAKQKARGARRSSIHSTYKRSKR